MKLDISKFKKASSDETCTILRDEKGHEIKIAHNALSSALKKQLSSLPQHFAEGGEVKKEEQLYNENPADALAKKDESLDKYLENPPTEISAPTESAPIAEPTRGLASVAAPTPVAPAPQVSQSGLGTPVAALGGLKKEERGIAQEASAIGELGKQEAGIIQQEVDEVKKIQDNSAKREQELIREGQGLKQDFLNGHINPDRYMESRTSGQKVRTAIGLLLSGIGSGLTGQENMAEKFLNDQIARDVKAQEQNLGKKQTMLDLNMKELGNLKDATQKTIADTKYLYAAKLNQAAALAKDPIAKAKAMQAAGRLEFQANEAYKEIAVKQSMLEATNNVMNSGAATEQDFMKKVNVLSVANKDAANDLKERLIPGVGVAAIKPTDKDREALASTKQLKDALTNLQARAATIGTTLPGTEADKVNKTLVAAIQLQMKNAYQLGVLSQSDLDMLQKLVSDPGSILTGRSIAQLDATKKSMDALNDSYMQKLGVKPFQAAGKIRVSNGQKVFEIDPRDLESAKKDGFKQVQ